MNTTHSVPETQIPWCRLCPAWNDYIGGGVLALPTLVLGLLAAFVALGRPPPASPRGISLPSVLQAAH